MKFVISFMRDLLTNGYLLDIIIIASLVLGLSIEAVRGTVVLSLILSFILLVLFGLLVA